MSTYGYIQPTTVSGDDGFRFVRHLLMSGVHADVKKRIDEEARRCVMRCDIVCTLRTTSGELV
eukprot:2025270-Pyramimonas_sp.AAC.2